MSGWLFHLVSYIYLKKKKKHWKPQIDLIRLHCSSSDDRF